MGVRYLSRLYDFVILLSYSLHPVDSPNKSDKPQSLVAERSWQSARASCLWSADFLRAVSQCFPVKAKMNKVKIVANKSNTSVILIHSWYIGFLFQVILILCYTLQVQVGRFSPVDLRNMKINSKLSTLSHSYKPHQKPKVKQLIKKRVI